VLIFKVEGTFMCLSSSLGIVNLLSSLFRRGGLDLEAFLLERQFDLREIVSLGSNSSSS